MSAVDPKMRLPFEVRAAAWLCLLLSALVGVLSGTQAMELSHASVVRNTNMSGFGLLDEESMKVVVSANRSALDSMKGSRTAVLAGLSIACALAFVSAMRILRPGGLPRESIRRVLGASTLAAALLRTIDGAQWAAISRNSAVVKAVRGALASMPRLGTANLADFQRHTPNFLIAGVILQTLLVAGGFLLLSQYFQSSRIKQFVQMGDQSS